MSESVNNNFQVMDDGEVDKNLAIVSTVTEPDVVWQDVRKMEEADIYGLYEARTMPYFCRMPVELGASISKKMVNLNRRPCGGRIRFTTDSEYVAIRVVKPRRDHFMPHMSYLGASGFDAYERRDGRYLFLGSYQPKVEFNDGYEGILHFASRDSRDITLNFPLYDMVTEVYIGLQQDARTGKSPAYTYAKPVLFYGSSITEGGCASRPGNCYEGFLSRHLDMDYINLGFSGNALGEHSMAEYIAAQDMSVFVLDYDHNSQTENLQATQWDMYETVRKAHPDLPILMCSRTDISYKAEKERAAVIRRGIIRENYERTLAQGDTHVDFLDGGTIFPMLAGDDSTVDGAHPNDLGFFAMAMAMEPYLRKYLGADII